MRCEQNLPSNPNNFSLVPVYDITSLSLLPAELQNIVFSFLTADPCPNITFALARLSKSHYSDIIPRLYKCLVVTDDIVSRGVFEGLLAEANLPEPQAEERRLPSKRDLLEGCQSLVITSLSAMKALKGTIASWNMAIHQRRQQEGVVPDRLEGLFNKVVHLAFESRCIETICREDETRDGDEHAWPLKNLSHVCYRLPHPMPEEMTDTIKTFQRYCPHFRVLRIHNCKSGDYIVPGLGHGLGGDMVFYDMLPLEVGEGANDDMHSMLARQVDSIVDYCADHIVLWWTWNETDVPGVLKVGRPEIIITNLRTITSSDGAVVSSFSSPDTKQFLEDVQKEVRRRAGNRANIVRWFNTGGAK
ncbi:hypothetical protein B9479_003152 [Cryptococcus floricola]|uniref:Uncharacterized protein n=1 Tax=Cryptococcus floricola TaxID=2591691 RepID=A0A5D3B1V8_9TREE|nr:hypothetical protein B9479_003152 [Cryptococcus floricola]